MFRLAQQKAGSRALQHAFRRHQSNLPPFPSAQSSYFQLFEVPARFTLDKSDLKRKFLQWQRRVHPDTFAAGGSESMEQQAKAWSELINQAYKTLNSDLDRALYLVSFQKPAFTSQPKQVLNDECWFQLEQQGMEIEEADGHDDMELLALILETREALEEAETQESVDSIRAQNQQERGRTVERLQQLLDGEQWQEAKLEAIKLRYLENVEQVCREWMPGKEIVLQH